MCRERCSVLSSVAILTRCASPPDSVVDDWPSGPLRDVHGSLLGLYEGVMLTERSPLDTGVHLPDRITLFRGPLCRSSRGSGFAPFRSGA